MLKEQVLIDFLNEKGIPYTRFEDHIRVYFVDVFEALDIQWKCRDWDELAGVLMDFAAELEKATGWRRLDCDWDEDADGWIFFLEDGE